MSTDGLTRVARDGTNSSMSQSWTLVTGASGFLGSRLVPLLIERGERVKAFVRPGSRLTALSDLPPDRFQLAFGDVTIGHTVYRALAGCDRLYHLAADFRLGSPHRGTESSTVAGTRAVLEAAQERRLAHVVVTGSTSTLAAQREQQSVDEEHEHTWRDPEPYVGAKVAAERIALDFAAAGLPVSVALPSSIVGPGDHRPTPTGQGLLAYLAAGGGRWLPVPQGGVNVVDVDDVAQGHWLVMRAGRPGEKYILGGDDLTYEQLFAALSDLSGLPHARFAIGAQWLSLGATFAELNAWATGEAPLVTRRFARDFMGRFAWVRSAKAERELGYQHRPARDALAGSLRWFLRHGYVPPRIAEAMRQRLR